MIDWFMNKLWRLLYPESARDLDRAIAELDETLAWAERQRAYWESTGLMPDPKEVMKRHPELPPEWFT